MRRPGIICIHLPECREPLSLRVSLRLASCGDRGVPAGTCFENEVRQIDACFRPASLMATAPTNSSDSWKVSEPACAGGRRRLCSLPAHLTVRETLGSHLLPSCLPSSLLPPSSFLLSPVRVSCPERTFLKVRASEHGQASRSSPIAALRDPTCMFTLPSFTEQFPLPPPFSTRQGASRPGIDSIASHTRQGSPSFSLGLVGAGRWCAI